MTPQQANELLPCLHCDVQKLQEISFGDHYKFIECLNCGATGPTGESLAEVIAAWNRRAPAPTSEPGASIRDHEEFREDLLRLSTTQHRQTLKAIRKDIYDTIDRRVANAVAAALATPASPAEHVAEVGSTYQLIWAGSGPIAPIVEKHGLKVGSKLYAHPAADPAPLVAQASPVQQRLKQALHLLGHLKYLDDHCEIAPVDDLSKDFEGLTARVTEFLAVPESLPGLPTAEDYDEMLRGLCCHYGVGGYNSEGLMLPAVAAEKLRFALDEQYRMGRELAHIPALAPEASPLVEDAQRIVAGKGEPGPWKHPGAQAWSDEEREIYRANLRRGDRCPVCSVTMGGDHFPGCTRGDLGMVIGGAAGSAP